MVLSLKYFDCGQDPANGADRADTAQVQECIETIVLDKVLDCL